MLLFLLVTGCGSGEGEQVFPDSAITYPYSKRDPNVRPMVDLPNFQFDYGLVDKVSGLELYPTIYHAPTGDHGWRVTSKDGRQIRFTTKTYPNPGHGIFEPSKIVEIILAHPDSYFPHEQAIYPDQFAFDRIAAMLNVHRLAGNRGDALIVDNRAAYREQNLMAARERPHDRFQPANFYPDPTKIRGAADPQSKVYYPGIDSARYDKGDRSVVAPGGGRLTDCWVAGDKDQESAGAKWISADGKTYSLSLIPFRAYRPGYGPTRAFEITNLFQSEQTEVTLVQRRFGESTVPGKLLAYALNACEPLSPKDVGHFVIIDNRHRSPNQGSLYDPQRIREN